MFRILNSKRWSKSLKDFTLIYGFIFDKWYYSDERVARFDPPLAEVQWTHLTLPKLLSDEEAACFMQ